MKKALAIVLTLIIVLGIIGCSNHKLLTEDDIVDKVYVYEKEGAGGDFTIEIKVIQLQYYCFINSFHFTIYRQLTSYPHAL